MKQLSAVIALLLLISAQTFSQSGFKGLTPGKSTKAEVQKTLGQPLRQLSPTLAEYKSGGAEQIFVQYLSGSDEVARIEATYTNAMERATVLGTVNLPPRSMGWQVNSKNRLEEYFSAACVVLTYVGPEAATGVSRIGYYSRQLFDNASAKLPQSSLGKDPPGLNSAPADANDSASNRTAASYQELVAQADGALQTRDFQTVLTLSQRAIALDPKRPEAYTLAGLAQLYGMKDLAAAASTMRAAVERGGSANFGVSHDHDGFFNSYCQGTLNITSFGVNYNSTDRAHSFLVSRAEIKEAGLNRMVGAKFNSFHIKISNSGKTTTYNFAPGTLSVEESNLILQFLTTR
jgi:hypothetical protein